MERKCFTFLKSYFEAVQALPSKEDQADFYNAVCMYALTGEEPEVSGVVRALFLLAKPNIDASLKKAEAGAKGGSRNKSTGNKPEAESKQNEAEVKQTEANNKQNESNAEAKSKKAEAIKDKGVVIKEKENDKKEKAKKENVTELFASEFDDFWEEYPRRVNKDKARTIFVNLLRTKAVDFDTLIIALKKQKKSIQWTKDGGQFIPHPTTWLNQHRWMDELDVPDGGAATFEEVFTEAF